jgi:hypothetical protein
VEEHRTESSSVELEERLASVEELLCSGLALERVQRKIVEDYGAEIVADPTLDPERCARFVSDLGGKIVMTHSKALMEAKVDELAQRVTPPTDAALGLEVALAQGVDPQRALLAAQGRFAETGALRFRQR